MSTDIDRLVGHVQVMEPRRVEQVPERSGLVAQVKWDGIRMLAFVSDGGVRLQNRKLRERTSVYPEFQALRHRLSAVPALLDGEVVMFRDNRPSFPTVLRRELVGSSNADAALRRWGPATYCVFDVLFLAGEDLRSQPWRERDRLLHGLLEPSNTADQHDPGPRVHLTESFDDPSRLLESTRELGLEGIVLKDREAPYSPGKKHNSWWKLKHRRRQLAQVVGFRASGPSVTSLYLGALNEGELQYIGSAGSGLTQKVGRLLYDELLPDSVERAPVEAPKGVWREATWVRPRLVVEVEFQEWTPDGQLRHPVIVDFPRAELAQCVLEQEASSVKTP